MAPVPVANKAPVPVATKAPAPTPPQPQPGNDGPPSSAAASANTAPGPSAATSTSAPPVPEQPETKKLADLEQRNATLRKFNQFAKDTQGSHRRIITSDVLVDSIDNGVIKTKGPGGAIEQYKRVTMGKAEGIVRKDLEREGFRIGKGAYAG